MTTISAQTILRSRNTARPDKVLSTLLLRYPRWIHAEGRTHRQISIFEGFEIEFHTPSLMDEKDLSRNAGSSRATPVEKMIQDVINHPAIPLYWGGNQRGMQAGEEINAPVQVDYGAFFRGSRLVDREEAWLQAQDHAVIMARAFAKAGYHKQIVNRLLEPFSHITVLVSATEWSNFLALRDHDDAEPHIQLLAKAVRAELERTDNIQDLEPGQWHLPFVGPIHDIMTQRLTEQDFIKKSAACCASTSYKTVDGFEMSFERADEIFAKLVEKPPLHASPFEHVAQADRKMYSDGSGGWALPEQHGNFVGFRQYRKMLPNECL